MICWLNFRWMLEYIVTFAQCCVKSAVADLRVAQGTPPPILSISCIFWEMFAKSYVGVPSGELAPQPLGNPGSATDLHKEIRLLLTLTILKSDHIHVKRAD